MDTIAQPSDMRRCNDGMRTTQQARGGTIPALSSLYPLVYNDARRTTMSVPRKIEIGQLTTCEVDSGGEAVRLGFVDEAGNPTSVGLSFEQAEAIAMTLPRLLSNALKMRMHSAGAR